MKQYENNVKDIEEVCKGLEIKMHKFTPYHFRLTFPEKETYDFYPKSGKFNLVGSNNYFIPQEGTKEWILNEFFKTTEDTIMPSFINPDDSKLMPWGMHKGKAMINVPSEYLLWLYENHKCNGFVLKYIEDNMEVIKKEAGKNKR